MYFTDQFPFFELVKFLDSNSGASFSMVSAQVNKSVNACLLNPELWKCKLEKVINARVSFGNNPAEYWKDIYESITDADEELCIAKVLKMCETGRYEYVWIGYIAGCKLSCDTIAKALMKATNLRNTKTIELILQKESIDEKDLPLRTAIYNHNLRLFNLIANGRTLSRTYITTLASFCINVGEVDILEALLSILVDIEESRRNAFFVEIADSRNPSHIKASMLKILLRLRETKNGYSLRDYKSTKLSEDEASAIIDSGKVKLDYLYHGATPEAAMMFYNSSSYGSSLMESSLIVLSARDDLMLVALQEKCTPQDISTNTNMSIKNIIMEASNYDNQSVRLVVEAFNLTNLDYSVFNKTLSFVKETPFLFLCSFLRITVHQLEKAIMLYGSGDMEGKLPLFIELGVSLKLVAEKLAFNGDITIIKQLHKLGFSFNDCALDLINYYKKSKDIHRRIVKYIGYDPAIDQEDLLEYSDFYYESDEEEILYSLDKENINWDKCEEVHLFERLSPTARRHPKAIEGSNIVGKTLQKRILRRITPNRYSAIKNLVDWLNCVTPYSDEGYIVYKIEHNNYVITYLDGSVVTLKVNSLETKYSGLDMFSESGYPLTTRGAIKLRRRELLPR